jgi:hypothetical protein
MVLISSDAQRVVVAALPHFFHHNHHLTDRRIVGIGLTAASQDNRR